MTDFKIGDKVKIVGKIVPPYWNNTWVDGMNKYIGKEGIIESLYGRDGIYVRFGKAHGYSFCGYSFPKESLALLEIPFEEKTIEDI